MKRRNFIKTAGAASFATGTSMAYASSENPVPVEEQQIYEWRTYTMKFGGPAGELHQYLEKVLIPALNDAGVASVGAFEEVGQGMPVKLYLFIPYRSLAHMSEVRSALISSSSFQSASEDFNKLPLDRQIFNRYDTHLMEAFSGIPVFKKPNVENALFELRTYEGYSDDAVRRKVKMFNEEELDLFYKVNLNPVFFAQMIAGPQMPALTYMLWYKDMEARESAWKEFRNHPEWKRMVRLEEYANTVSNIIRVFLKSTAYSQV